MTRLRTVMLGLLAATTLAVARPAAAEDNARRDPAYYRGRVERPPPEDGALWVPRVLFFPMHLVTEFVLRRPILAVTQFAETNHIAESVNHGLNPTTNFSWSPTLVADLGLITSGGLRFTLRNVGVAGNEMRGSVATGGLDFWHVAFSDRYTTGSWYLGALADFLTRPDRPFYGLGTTSRIENLTYYTLTRLDAMVNGGFTPSNHVQVHLSGGLRRTSTGPGQWPPVDTVFNAAAIPGYGLTLNLLMATAQLHLDSRHTRYENTGVRFAAHGTYALDALDTQRQWVALELEGEGAVELGAPNRVLALSAYAMDTQSLGTQAVPFTEQAILGIYRLPGFLWGRYIGPSAAVFEASYRYPIWESLDAVWIAAAGNVFGPHLIDFRPGALAGTFAVGFRTRFAAHDAIELLAAVGTSRFEEPFAIEGFRLHVGINPGL